MQRVFSLGFFFLWPLLMGLAVAPSMEHSHSQTSSQSREVAVTAAGSREEWLGVYQDGEKVGYLHRRLTPTKTGYNWEEHWWLNLRLFNETRLTHTEVHAQADRTCALTSFSLWSAGAGLAFYIKANVTNQGASRQAVHGESISNGDTTPFTVSLPLPLHLPPLCQMAVPIPKQPGVSRKFSVFNPVSLQTETVSLIMLGSEMIALNGHPQIATKLASVISDTALYVWLDKEGRTLKEEIAPGVILRQESRELATKGSWQERGLIPPRSSVEFLDSSNKEAKRK